MCSPTALPGVACEGCPDPGLQAGEEPACAPWVGAFCFSYCREAVKKNKIHSREAKMKEVIEFLRKHEFGLFSQGEGSY